jgi:hypothetical protein
MRIIVSGTLLAGLAVAGLAVFGSRVVAVEPAVQKEAPKKDTFTYVGATKCKTCHKKPEAGEQYRIWSESGHAKAFEVLASEAALAEAKKRGIADPQKAPECLQCHATAFAVMDDLANQKIKIEEGVSCEGCHGAGSGYSKKSVKKKIAAGEIEGASVGLWDVTEETCTKCHTPEGNAFFKEFVYEERLKKIAHPTPEGYDGGAEEGE